jgi:epoxyqueuosine reductase
MQEVGIMTARIERPVPRRGLSRVEAAMYLGISPSKFDELRKSGRIGPAKILDSRKLYAIEMLDEFFRQKLVREDQIAAVVPRAAGGGAARAGAVQNLRRSRFLDLAALKAELIGAARALGFDVAGVVRPDAIPLAAPRLREFLAAGAHGDMAWMAANAERRGDPRALWSEVRSILMLGINYGPDCDPLAVFQKRNRGAISVYSRGDDYHDLIKSRLKQIGRWLIDRADGDVKVFVDTAPVMEKPLAEAAGLGWQGKHTNLVSRQFGSWLFLGAVFTTLELSSDTPETDHCGQCRACLDICPTAAFPAPYRLDARRCISYLTIEHKGQIPRELRPLMGNRIYGCDDCLAVCPWNKFAVAGREAKLAARETLRAPPLADLVRLDDGAFRALFAKSAVKRIGRARFVRNVLIAIGNSGDANLAAEAERLLDDESPLVRGAAVWALGRLDCDRLRACAKTRRDNETDPELRAEWTAALSEARQ